MNSVRLYFSYLMVSVRAQLQYRVSFLMQALAQFFITGIEFLGLAAVFQRFGNIKGWSLAEVGLFYGMISLAFAIAEAVTRGFDVFHRLVVSGEFDRMLVRPRTCALQVLGQEMQMMRVGRFVQGLMVLVWASSALDVQWDAARVGLLVAAVVGGAALFSGLFVLQATICFWTVESIEIANCATYGGVEAGQFPLTIYRAWFRDVFVFVIPLATINYFPAHAILGRADVLGSPVWLQWMSPLAGFVFLGVCLMIWGRGVRRYTSTGS